MLERYFPAHGVDLDGDGSSDFDKPPSPLKYYSKNLLPTVLLIVVVQMISAGIYMALDGWDFGTAIYHCIVTATTVGYGDVDLVKQSTRLWSCFHILISVAMIGELISTIDALRAARAKTMARVNMLATRLSSEMLDHLSDHAKELRPKLVRDGKGLTELEFVLAMMIELGVTDQSLVQPFIKQFRLLDVDGNARLSREDLQMSCDKSLSELQANADSQQQQASRAGSSYSINMQQGMRD